MLIIIVGRGGCGVDSTATTEMRRLHFCSVGPSERASGTKEIDREERARPLERNSGNAHFFAVKQIWGRAENDQRRARASEQPLPCSDPRVRANEAKPFGAGHFCHPLCETIGPRECERASTGLRWLKVGALGPPVCVSARAFALEKKTENGSHFALGSMKF